MNWPDEGHGRVQIAGLDHRNDVAGRDASSNWWIAVSNGTGFTTTLWTTA